MQRRLEALEKAHRELEDSFIVMTHLETRMGKNIRESAEWLANHEERIRRAELTISDKLAQLTIKMAEMTEKVDFLIDREMRREGGPESR